MECSKPRALLSAESAMTNEQTPIKNRAWVSGVCRPKGFANLCQKMPQNRVQSCKKVFLGVVGEGNDKRDEKKRTHLKRGHLHLEDFGIGLQG